MTAANFPENDPRCSIVGVRRGPGWDSSWVCDDRLEGGPSGGQVTEFGGVPGGVLAGSRFRGVLTYRRGHMPKITFGLI